MANNEIDNKLPVTADSNGIDADVAKAPSTYHAPNFVHYGALAELVQINPGSGPDGGTGDCQHS
jgi:hypothetical protein